MKTKLRAGFDYSWNEGAFSCMTMEGELLFEEYIILPPRNASRLTLWMEECLKKVDFSMDDICEWSVGNGPGSFTGLRLAAAFVMGRTFAKEGVRVRGVPSACGLTYGLPENSGENIAALFDGRRNELLAYGLTRSREDRKSFRHNGDHGIFGGETTNAPEELLKKYDAFAALKKDEEILRSITDGELFSRIIFREHISASALIQNDETDFSISLKEPVYLRPAVFVDPKIPRNL